ncbi:hypothetical protein K8I85_06050, partial [bacterium]|nr:hypothetical protein [bacterium]
FPDGADVDDSGDPIEEISCGYGGWAVADTVPPSWAFDDIIESTVPPVNESSITSYYYEMSQGQHIIQGSTYDSVFVAPHTIAHYDSLHPESITAIRIANEDLLAEIEDAPGLHFNEIDFIFVYWHSGRTSDGTVTIELMGPGEPYGGVSWLTNGTITLDGKEFGIESGATLFSTVTYDNQTLYKVRHPWMWLGLAAHEYGHDLVGQELSATHITTTSRYGIMHGTTAPPSLMMSPVLRIALGWLSPDSIDCSVPVADVLDSLSTDRFDESAYRVLTTDDPSQSFILQGLQWNAHPYMTPQPIGNGCLDADSDSVRTARTVIAPAGLLITHVMTGGVFDSSSTTAPLIDIEVATGKFSASTGAPNPETGRDRIEAEPEAMPWNSRASDAFFAGQSTVTFGPYTNPGSGLYNSGSIRQDVYSGIHVFDVDLNQSTRMVKFHILSDGGGGGSGADTLRADTTWKGLVQLTGDLVVPSGVTLTVAEGCRVVVAAADRLDTGVDDERVEIHVLGDLELLGSVGSGVTITSSRDNTFVHYGGSKAAGDIAGESDDPAAGDWYGARFPDVDSQLTTSYVGIGYARAAIADENASADWPDLAGLEGDIDFAYNVADVGFDRDHTVASDSVVFPPGISIGFAETDADSATNGGKSPDCELIVADGAKLLAVGSPGSEIRIGSTVPDAKLQGDEWYGGRLQAVGVEETGYGFLACVDVDPDPCPPDLCSYCDAEKSEFKHVRISGSTFGLAIEGNLAPELDNVTFDHITGNRDIYLDGRDVVIPVDFTWNLVAPTDVVARKVTSLPDTSDYKYGTEDRDDLVVEGALITSSAVAGSTVTFRPDEVGILADDWGGVALIPTGAVRSIEDADFGYAQTPLFLYYPDSTIVLRDKEIHHFGDVG